MKQLLCAIFLLGFSLNVFAAQNESVSITRYLVTIDLVKPEMMTKWSALQKNKVMPAMIKAGVSEGKVYRTVFGDTTEMMGPEEMAAFFRQALD